MAQRLILCDCLGTQKLDTRALSTVEGLKIGRVHHALCTEEQPTAAAEIARGDCIIACAQECARFEEMAAEADVAPPPCIDLRDRAGWSREGADAGPKMAALLADALLQKPPVRLFDIVSGGHCLILGRADLALDAARRLAGSLAVSVLVGEIEPDEIPLGEEIELIVGRLKRASGALGRFEIRIDALQQVLPAGRSPALSPPRNGAGTSCDIILDLRGEAPLFAASHKRDGYLRADPGDPRAVGAALMEAAQLAGEFEKPLYSTLEPGLCAHARAGITGCTRCIDSCPTGALSPDGDSVALDPLICAGCGGCSAVCPSGAIRHDAPDAGFLFTRMSTMREAFEKAGGTAPRLLVHDEEFGAEMIRLSARHGAGLPADVLPLELPTLSIFGHAEMLAALAGGYASVDLLLGPRSERDLLSAQAELAEALGGAGRIRLLEPAEPDALEAALYGSAESPATPACAPVLAMGSRRQIARMAAQALLPEEEAPIPLPAGAPYGSVVVDTESCTLCLACAGLCPPGALTDNPDMPQLRFQEDACLQCGLCAALCPEKAIRLEPRMDLSQAALSQRVLNEEEPFACIECGTPFGVRSSIERIIEKLAGNNPMFADSEATRLLQMCDDCRVRAQFHMENSPLKGAEPPRVHSTDDERKRRREH